MKEFVRIKASNRSLAKRALVLGVGVNDAKHTVVGRNEGRRINCPSYSAWKNMLARCYFNTYKANNPTYNGCCVCDEWLIFSNFDSWYLSNFTDGYHLDKDLKVRGNKEYSPDKCMYIPPEVNNLIITSNSGKGRLPVGVKSNNSKTKKYRVVISQDGKKKIIGYFATTEEASLEYRRARNVEIVRKCRQYPLLSEHLLQHLEPL